MIEMTPEQEKEAIKRAGQRMAEVEAKQCRKEMTTLVWGNKMNPDTWNCARKKGHKGAHKRYPKEGE